jgi:Tat protein secretion system quality control protein TatD with DNase activity
LKHKNIVELVESGLDGKFIKKDGEQKEFYYQILELANRGDLF